MQADLSEIRVRLKEHPELVRQMTDSAITLSDPDEILQNLQTQIQDDFPALTDTSYTLKYVPEALESSLSPAFFLVPPIDSDGSNTIYINEKASTEQNLYTMLAHEGYPGHLYQSAYFNDREPVPVRRLLACGGYNEGWGLYSELYAYSFDNGLPEAVKPLMRCSEASSYGLYALLDICIHYDGWDLATTTSYLENSYGFTDPESAREIYLAIIDNPGNYLKYYTGYLEILTMRQEADEVLGNKFNAKSFHQFILNMDGASFRVIKPYFQTWLMTEKYTYKRKRAVSPCMHPQTSGIPLFSHFHALVYFLVILLKAHRTVADLLACYAQLQRLCLVVLDKCIGNGHDNQLVRGLL